MKEGLALEIKNVSKQYRLGVTGTGTISHDFNRWWHRVRGKEDPYAMVGEENDRTVVGGDYVWAIKDINLEVKQGEILGIIGKNGAGKSTLLKILSKITGPTTGSIAMRGRMASLLEVGTGFHPELTGRENIYLNGAILGMSKREISSKLDDIVDFSGCAKYVDTPVKRYSSGMRVRLGFAVAAFLEPDILVVDEVLAVGDAEFQKQAIGKMKEVSSKGGRTVLFVSHNMASIIKLCSSSIVMEKGKVSFIGETMDAVGFYLKTENANAKNSGSYSWDVVSAPGTDDFRLKYIATKLVNGDVRTLFSNLDEIQVCIEIEVLNELQNMRLNFSLLTSSEVVVFSSSSHSEENIVKEQGKHYYTVNVPGGLLNQGRYVIQLQAGIPGQREILNAIKVLSFDIEKISDSGTIINIVQPGVVAPFVKWKVNKN